MPPRTPKRLALVVIAFILALTASLSSSSSHSSGTAVFSANGNLIQYTSFSGVSYQLHAFDGRYVRYALPDSWLGAQGFTTEEINQLVDLTDLTYAHMSELLPAEPQGDGLLTIAVVDVGAQDGLGLSGAKGVEISPAQIASVRQSLRVGLLPENILHEMCHNYDLFNRYLGYYGDWRHAWTTFLIPYTQYYMQTGSLQFAAPDILNAKISQYTTTWDKPGTAATWERCVRDQSCSGIIANEAWAGFMLRYARLHGQDSIVRSLSYLKTYKDSHPNPPQTAEEMNDLLVRAFAYGAGSNITCELDAWKWSVTQATRNELSSSYPASSFCADADRDNFSPLAGDSNDQDSKINPGAAEVPNNLDDDCDGITDDILLKETTDFPSLPSDSSPVAQLPAHITGYAEQQGQDAIIINVTSLGLLKLKLRNRDEFHGWIALTNRDGLTSSQSFYNLTSPEATFVVDRPGQWVVIVTPDAGLISNDPGGAGNYDLTVEQTAPESDPINLQISASSTTGALHITASIDPSVIADAHATQIRFWASGEGFIATRPISANVSFDWTPLKPDTPVAIRAELLNGSYPASRPTAPLWVNSSTAARLNFKTDLALIACSLPPPTINYDQTATLGFEVINNGPATAENVIVNITLDPALKIESSQTTRGQFQSSSPNASVLTIGRLPEAERVVFNVKVSGLSARGDTNSSLQLTSSAIEAEPSDNTRSITMKVTGPVPDVYVVRPLPIRPDNTAAARVSVTGGLSRAYVPLANLTLAALFSHPDSTGSWPAQLGGFAVTVGGQTATVIAVTPAPELSLVTSSYNVDFAVPENAPTGVAIAVTVTYQPLNITWTTTTEIQDSAPALWAANGTSIGDALAQEADTFIQITDSHPAVANNQNRIALYATGIRKLASNGALRVRAVTSGGQELLLPIDYAGPQQRFPGLDQINIKLPEALSGRGKVTIKIDGSDFSRVYLPVR